MIFIIEIVAKRTIIVNKKMNNFLTKREKEVFDLLVKNKTTKENAKNRNIYVLNRSFSLVVAKVTSNGMVEELVRNYNKEIKYLDR